MCRHCTELNIFTGKYESQVHILLKKLAKADAHGNFNTIVSEIDTKTLKILSNIHDECVDSDLTAFAILVQLEAQKELKNYYYSIREMKDLSDNAIGHSKNHVDKMRLVGGWPNVHVT